MSETINARIQRSLNPNYRRSVSLPNGDGRFIDYFIPNESEPSVQVGEVVGVRWTVGDQFAFILPNADGLAGSVQRPTEPNPRFQWITAAERERFPDLPEMTIDGQYVLWDRQEKKPVAVIFAEYANAVCLETYRMIEGLKLVDGQPFTNLEEWFNSVDNESLDSEGIITTKPPFRSNGI